MMELNVFNIEGKETGKKVTLDDSIFGIEPNNHAIYLDTKQYMVNNRQGTAKAKERCEITGSTRKLKRQKGTGSARYGDIKNPLFRGGGRIFGPRPRDYSLKVNKKVKQLARKSALSYKAAENGIIILEDFNMETPKTNEMVKISENLKISSKKSLFVLPKQNKNIYLSSRNLQGVEVVTVNELTTYKIMNASILVLAEGAVDILQETFKN